MYKAGFKTMIHTSLRSDGKAIYKDVPLETVKLAQEMGWRIWDGSAQPNEARAFDPVAARQKEERELEKLQIRVDRMLELGLKPEMKVLRQLSDAEFESQIAAFIESEGVNEETEETEAAAQTTPATRGRKKA